MSRPPLFGALLSFLLLVQGCLHFSQYYNRGLAKYESGDLEGAIVDFTKAIELNPDFPEAFNNRGLAKLRKGDLEGAIRDFSKALEINPGLAKAYYNRGIAYQQLFSLDLAIEDFSKAIELKPENADVYNNRGNAKAENGDLEGAVRDFSKALEINPVFAGAYTNRGIAHYELEEFELALADFKMASKLDPQKKVSDYIRACEFRLKKIIWPMPENSSSPDEDELHRLLENAGNYCEKVKSVALFYVCRERIVHKKYYYRPRDSLRRVEGISIPFVDKKLELKSVKKKTFLYEYQLIRKSGEMKEKRLLLEEDGKTKKVENAELPGIKYFSEFLVFGPVGFLSRYWQDFFNYEIIVSEAIGGHQAILIRSFPRERGENMNFGKIWIDSGDFSILKIEWEPRSIKDYKEEQWRSPVGILNKTVVWNAVFGIEKTA